MLSGTCAGDLTQDRRIARLALSNISGMQAGLTSSPVAAGFRLAFVQERFPRSGPHNMAPILAWRGFHWRQGRGCTH